MEERVDGDATSRRGDGADSWRREEGDADHGGGEAVRGLATAPVEAAGEGEEPGHSRGGDDDGGLCATSEGATCAAGAAGGEVLAHQAASRGGRSTRSVRIQPAVPGVLYTARGDIDCQQRPLLSDRQKVALELIWRNVDTKGYAPTFREMRDALHVASTNVVNGFLVSLEKKGYIRRARGHRGRARNVLPLVRLTPPAIPGRCPSCRGEASYSYRCLGCMTRLGCPRCMRCLCQAKDSA